MQWLDWFSGLIPGTILGALAASLWWRHRCARLAAGEAQRRRDRAERIERVTAAVEPGGGKSQVPKPPPIELDPCLDNYVLEGGKLKPPPPARWAR